MFDEPSMFAMASSFAWASARAFLRRVFSSLSDFRCRDSCAIAFIRVSFGSLLQAPHIRLKRLLAIDLLQLQERESTFRRQQSLGVSQYFTQKSLCDDRIGARVARAWKAPWHNAAPC